MSIDAARALRIVSVSHYFPARRGGIEIVALEINRRLAARGHRVDWFASAGALPQTPERLQCHPMQAMHLVERLLGVPLPVWFGRGLPALWSAIRQADAVHVHDFIYPGSLLAMAFARWHSKQVVLTQHIGQIPYDSKLMAATLSIVNRVVGKIALRSAGQVVFISDAVQSYFSALVGFRRAPAYIPNGVNTAVFHPVSQEQREAARALLGIAAHAGVCLFVGRFVEKKGMKLLHQVVPLTPGVNWIFAGHGPLQPPSPPGAQVRVFEALGHAELANLYRVADLLVLPSQGEGFPLVVQEAFACGLPAVVSDSTAAGCEQARHLLDTLPVTGELAAGQWQTGLTALLADRAALRQRRAAVANFATRCWRWDDAVDQYEQFYRARQPS